MADVEKQLTEIVQQNPPEKVASSIVTARDLTEKYRSKYIQLRNKMIKDASIGLLYFAVVSLPVIASIISGEMIYLAGCAPAVVPLALGFRKYNSIRRNIPRLLHNLDMYIDLNETALFLVKYQKPK